MVLLRIVRDYSPLSQARFTFRDREADVTLSTMCIYFAFRPPPTLPALMMSVISLALTKAVLELLLCGMYFVLFIAVMYFFRSGFMAYKNRPLLLELGIVVQFLIIVAHLTTSIVAMYLCLQETGGGATTETCFGRLNSGAAVANLALFVLASLVTDMLVIQRLWVIWTHRRQIIAFPILLLLVQAAGGVGILVTLGSENESRATLLSLSNGWVTTTLVASLLISVYSSCMIYWRISRMVRQSNELSGEVGGGGRLMSALAIMIESAGIQTWVTVLLLICFDSGLSAATILTGIGPAIFGISTVLIHARVGLGWAKQAHESISSGRGHGQGHALSASERLSAGTLRFESPSRRLSIWP
ncbi:hypothetical protein MVEN_02500700 [Mycena venus]|uniref:Uncharacterized protein n=1 Tax=Mycena venus TaxID=2733690 RepID=A0A8H6U4H5_9AGAR|nr:hypothetical protein MVEN_02500700 [Mycena venus]